MIHAQCIRRQFVGRGGQKANSVEKRGDTLPFVPNSIKESPVVRTCYSLCVLGAGLVALVGCTAQSSTEGDTTNIANNLVSQYVSIDLKSGVVRSATTNSGPGEEAISLGKLPDGSYIGIYPVTKGQWKTVMGTAPWRDLSGEPQEIVGNAAEDNNRQPACNLSRDDALAFSQKVASMTGMKVVLPAYETLRSMGQLALSQAPETCAVWETAVSVNRGFEDVDARQAFAGVAGPIGNVRTWDQDGTLVGASWLDGNISLVSRRFDEGVRHPLAGARIAIGR